MDMLLRAAAVVTPDEEFAPGWTLIRDGTIESVGGGEGPAGVPATDLAPLTLVPGFVDIHVHGGGGFSLLNGDPEEVRAYARWAAGTGVTSFLAGVCAESFEIGLAAVESIASMDSRPGDGAELLGVNLEGPFVSSGRLGALPEGWPQPPTVTRFGRLARGAGGGLRVMTLAPELPGALALIAAAAQSSVVVSLGHTDATYREADAAFRAGASHVTHAFNAMRTFHHREPGVIGAALQSPGVTMEVIADGVHLHPATVSMLVAAFGPERVALVTDAVPPAGLPGGSFRIGGVEAVNSGGRIELPDGTIAGGAATMDDLVRNVVTWRYATLAEASRMASTVPASVAGAVRKGRIAPGYDADLVALTPDLHVAATWVGGRRVYESALR